MKPGFYVSAKVSKLFENGLELSFMSGLTGTVFADHTGTESLNKFKTGQKLQARVIYTDVASKAVGLSLLPELLSLTYQPKVSVGEVFNKVTVEKQVYGNSFLVRLNKDTVGFLHKSHIKEWQERQNAEESDDGIDLDVGKPEKKKKKGKKVNKVQKDDQGLLKVGQVIDVVRIKEINFFDGMPLLTMREELVQSTILNYD